MNCNLKPLWDGGGSGAKWDEPAVCVQVWTFCLFFAGFCKHDCNQQRNATAERFFADNCVWSLWRAVRCSDAFIAGAGMMQVLHYCALICSGGVTKFKHPATHKNLSTDSLPRLSLAGRCILLKTRAAEMTHPKMVRLIVFEACTLN